MPRTFGQIKIDFWFDEKMNAATDAERLLAVFLIAGIHTNSLGIFRCPMEAIPFDIKWTPEKTERTFNSLIKLGFIEYCEQTGYVWVKNYLRHNWPRNTKNRKGTINLIDSLPIGVRFKTELGSIRDLLLKGEQGSPIDRPSIQDRCIDKNKDKDSREEEKIEDIDSRERIEDKDTYTDKGEGEHDPSKTASRLDAKSPTPPIGPNKNFTSVVELKTFLHGVGYKFTLGRHVSARVEEVLPLTADEVGRAVEELRASGTEAHPLHFVADYVEFNR